MITISNQYAGKRVRIQGVIPIEDATPMLGQGNHVGVIESVDGRKFRFREEGYSEASDTKSLYSKKADCAHLSVSMWRITEILGNSV